MFRNLASTQAAHYGTPEEAKAMLDRAIAAVKADKTKALDLFNKGEGGFKNRDLYVFCAPRLGGAPREGYLFHQGRRPDLLRRLLQVS
jgi:hypothetical protein